MNSSQVFNVKRLGFWRTITKHWPQTKQQRCLVHKTANVLNKVSKSMQSKVKESLYDIWMSYSKDNAKETHIQVFKEPMRSVTSDRWYEGRARATQRTL
ncbi:MAG: transposase [Gammaproteobacteria bacterium]|nr:transposase [Gammaproteobacteria bacterium]